MFVRYFLELSLPFDQVERALLHAPDSWIPGLAREVEGRSEQLLIDVGFGTDGHRVEQQVEIEVREPLRFPSRTVLPIAWRPAQHGGLFPTLEGDVEVAAVGPHRTQLAMNARYRPPLGSVGRAVDRALMHRVAEATVKDFLDRAGESLLEMATESPAVRS